MTSMTSPSIPMMSMCMRMCAHAHVQVRACICCAFSVQCLQMRTTKHTPIPDTHTPHSLPGEPNTSSFTASIVCGTLTPYIYMYIHIHIHIHIHTHPIIHIHRRVPHRVPRRAPHKVQGSSQGTSYIHLSTPPPSPVYISSQAPPQTMLSSSGQGTSALTSTAHMGLAYT